MTWTTRPRSKRDGIAYVVAGQGPHVLFLHGVGLRAEAWGAQIDALVAAGFRVMAPDMLGHGETPFAPAQSIAEYAAPLAAFLETQTVIVGHSMGAMMAVELASSYAQNVRGVAALNAIYQRDAAAKAAVQSRVAALDGVTQSD
ncbi:MAG: alpha/beta fold hydrolase, partial [Rhodobacteraceae bacterium]|nr:alpha/beta fold hydrolase [Paracoccaceae bacterium]